MLCNPYFLADPQNEGIDITKDRGAHAVSGVKKRVEMLHHPCIMGGP